MPANSPLGGPTDHDEAFFRLLREKHLRRGKVALRLGKMRLSTPRRRGTYAGGRAAPGRALSGVSFRLNAALRAALASQ